GISCLRLSDLVASRGEEPAMPGPTPPAVPLAEGECHELHTLLRAHTTPPHLRGRVQGILLLAEGRSAPTSRTASARRPPPWGAGVGTGLHATALLSRSTSTTPRDRQPPPPSSPHKGARSWRWLVRPRARQDGPAALGPGVHWLTRFDTGGVERPSRRAMA